MKNDFKLQVILFLGITFLEFVVLELFFGALPSDYSLGIICKNVLIIGALNLLLVGLFHSLRAPMLLSVAFCIITGIANYFMIDFRGYGIVFMDFYAVRTAAGVAGAYHCRIDGDFVLAFAAGAALFAVCLFLPKREHSYRDIRCTLISLLGMAASVFFFFWISSDTVFYKNISHLTWDHNIGMKKYGYVLYFASNAGKATVERPTGYSVKKVDKILSAYAVDSEEPSSEKPHLIFIMNESFADLSVLGNIRTDKRVMPFYSSLTENAIKGYLDVSVYGGYTANSEFEFLTGCTKAFLPGNPYLQYTQESIPTVISNLKGQAGYRTATAIHPYHPSGYNRNRVYPLFGFDTFLSLEDFKGAELVRGYVSDAADYQKIVELYEKRKKGEKLLLFNVTMQNHNPYDKEVQFEEPVHVTSFQPESSVNQYLSLLRLSDKALGQLVAYFQKVEEPVMLVFFGDHQPHLSDSFYQEAMGVIPDFFTTEQTTQKYLTPFLIWANYDIPEQEIDRISLNYLSTLVLQVAGLPMSDYNRYLLDLQKKIPSITAKGYYDEKGNFYDISKPAKEHQELIQEYKMIQYNYLFGGEERLNRHFTVE